MTRLGSITFGLAFATAAMAGVPTPQKTMAEVLREIPGLVDASESVPGLLVELKYATTDNFLKKNVYGDLKTCFLQKEAAAMLATAAQSLEERAPGLRLLAYDCTRPRRVQLQMWEIVTGTPAQGYVANPHGKTGSVHNYGCAVDLTLAQAKGKALDMGTAFDHFGIEAQPRRETELIRKGVLNHAQLANRVLLREVMVRAGFYPIGNEWWHFNCTTRSETRRRYKIVP